jgi:ParB-like chromosome segregation protein Spo0J
MDTTQHSLTIEFDTVDPSKITPFHEVKDEDLFEEISASMKANGWIGEDILVVEGAPHHALTGSHRWAAADELGLEIPVTIIKGDGELAEEIFASLLEASDNDEHLALLTELGLEEAVKIMEAEVAKA